MRLRLDTAKDDLLGIREDLIGILGGGRVALSVGDGGCGFRSKSGVNRKK